MPQIRTPSSFEVVLAHLLIRTFEKEGTFSVEIVSFPDLSGHFVSTSTHRNRGEREGRGIVPILPCSHLEIQNTRPNHILRQILD